MSDHPEDDYLDCVGCSEPMLPLWPPPPGRDVLGRCPVCRAGELTLVPHLSIRPDHNDEVLSTESSCPLRDSPDIDSSLLDTVQL